MKKLSRRDILKLSAAALGGAALATAKPLSRWVRSANADGKPNVVVLILDAMSARNLSLYGYGRRTTPGFEIIAERAIVYHNHYAAGNFTTTGTATLLTGLYPWTHRGVDIGGLVARSIEKDNIFRQLGEGYNRVAFTQNQLAYLLLGQFSRDVDDLMARTSFAFQQNVPMTEDKFTNDRALAYYTFADFLGASEFYLNPASTSLGLLDVFSFKRSELQAAPNYPRGFPYNYHTYFKIEDILNGLAGTLADLAGRPDPFFTYFHLLPPHSPYNPRKDYLEPFVEDGFVPASKPAHPLLPLPRPEDRLARHRIAYDAFVANVDYEVTRFLYGLERSGLLDSTYVFITSDHGELFERGDYGHGTALMYDPVVHVPLLVLAPGQTRRRDVYSLTSNADLAPTILSLTGNEQMSRSEGKILPGLGGDEETDRAVYAVHAKENSSFLPLDTAVFSMRKGEHHLLYYRGYKDYNDHSELYHLAEDPEELSDLAGDDPSTAKRMKEELLEHVNAADAPYRRK